MLREAADQVVAGQDPLGAAEVVDHGELPLLAGEQATIHIAAAIGNAIFDATGVRLREVPFTPKRVLAALQKT